MLIDVPSKILKTWKADLKSNTGLDVSSEQIHKAFHMLYLWKGKAYISDVFMNGKSWLPRLHPDERKWLAYYIEHGKVIEEEKVVPKKRGKRKKNA